MDYPCGKFGNCSFSRFWLCHADKHTHTQNHTQTDADEHFTPATVIIVSNNVLMNGVVARLYLPTVSLLGTCEASRFDFNLNRTIPIRFESDAPAVIPQISLAVQQKTLRLCRCN